MDIFDNDDLEVRDDDELYIDYTDMLGGIDELPLPKPVPKLNVDVMAVIDVTGSMENMIEVIKHDVTNLRTLVFERLN